MPPTSTSSLTVDRRRLLETFLELVQIDSPSRGEGPCATYCARRLEQAGFHVAFDAAAGKVGGEVGNLVASRPGSGRKAEPILLSAHLDTVPLATRVHPVFEDGWITTDGTSALGADDKAGVAILLELAASLHDVPLRHPPIEIVLTVCEEIGLLGVKNLDTSLLSAKNGLVFDGGAIHRLIHRAPACNSLSLELVAPVSPPGCDRFENVDALQVAAEALSHASLGRLDPHTTAVLGQMEAGSLPHLVPDRAFLRGEVRSFDDRRLEEVTQSLHDLFQGVATKRGLALVADIHRQYVRLEIAKSSPFLSLVRESARRLGRGLILAEASGGCDANMLTALGIPSLVLGTGMVDCHTTRERVRIDDLVQTVELTAAILEEAAS